MSQGRRRGLREIQLPLLELVQLAQHYCFLHRSSGGVGAGGLRFFLLPRSG